MSLPRRAAYNIVVPVKDDGTGQLEGGYRQNQGLPDLARRWHVRTPRGDDQSGTLHQECRRIGTAVFTNVFDVDSEDWTPSATKVLTD